MRGTVAVAGSVAQRPLQGGHTWVFLQYLLGFRRLGYKVLLLDRLTPEMCFDNAGKTCEWRQSVNVGFFLALMERCGLSDCFSLNYNRGECVLGLSEAEVLDRVRDCDYLFNFMNFLDDEQLLAAARRRVFVDIDPGFGQMW